MTRKRKTEEEDQAAAAAEEVQTLSDPESGVDEPPKDQPATPVPAPAPPPAVVPFRTFEAACGIKVDQLAGFKHFVKKNNLGPRPMRDWQAELAAFRARPIK